MIDTKTPDSPGWWLQRCSDKLATTQKRVAPLYDRYEGRAPLPEALATAPDAAKIFWKTARTTFAEMLVKVVRYRLRIVDWITDDEGAAVEGGSSAYRAWVSAGGAAEQHDINRHMLVAGDGYSMTAMYEGAPAITAEDPRQVVTIHDPVRQVSLRAAAKFFHDDDYDEDLAYLYRPEGPTSCRRWVARRDSRRRGKSTPRFSGSSWEWDERAGGADGELIESPMPVVRHRNEEGVGEFERHIDILNRVDHLVLQGMVIATLQAFKQRAIKVDAQDMPDKDPDTGEEIDYNEVFTADPGALWRLPTSAEMWESGAVDVGPITTMATKALEQLSAVTFTPLSTFTPEAANQSATGASLVKEGQTAKVEDKQDRLTESYRQQMSILGHLLGEETMTDPWAIRPRWAPAERYSLTEKAAGSTGAQAAGMPFAAIMRNVWQMDPQEIARMMTERSDDAFQARVAALTAQTQASAV